MAIIDITGLVVFGIGAILCTVLVFIWRGIVWLSILSGVFWLLLGFMLVQRTQEGTALIPFQEYMGMLFIGVGIVMTLSFMWLKAKNMDVEKNAPQDIDIYGDDIKGYNRDRIDSMKEDREFGSGRRKKSE